MISEKISWQQKNMKNLPGGKVNIALWSVLFLVWAIILSGPQIRVRNWKLFSYFSTKTYVVGTRKNRLDETVLLSTQNTCLNWWIWK